MMTEEQRTERFEAYLAGIMTEDDREIFDSELAQDQSLREELKMHKKANSAITYLNMKALKQKLVLIDAEGNPIRKQSQFRRIGVRIAVAATIALVVGLGFYFATDYFGKDPTLAELSEEYFAPTQQEKFRGENAPEKTGYDEQLVQADLLYQKGDYEGAIVEYNRLSKINNTLNDRAEWNLALSYLLSESHKSEFESLFNQILTDQAHMYHEQAVKLQKELQ